jgi:hypothetical protein
MQHLTYDDIYYLADHATEDETRTYEAEEMALSKPLPLCPNLDWRTLSCARRRLMDHLEFVTDTLAADSADTELRAEFRRTADRLFETTFLLKQFFDSLRARQNDEDEAKSLGWRPRPFCE